MDSNIKDRILIHLHNYNHQSLKRKTSFYVSQKGIAEVVEGSRSRVSRILREMKDNNLIKIKKKYIDNGKNRKQKVYFLTKKGKKEAEKLKGDLKEEYINIKKDDEIKNVKLKKYLNDIDSNEPFLDILVRLKDKDTLDLSDNNFNNTKPNFIDRNEEINKLKGKIQDIKNEGCEVLFITGEAGCGKTTLIKQLKKSHDDENIEFLSGKAYTESSDFYLPLKNAFKNFEKYDGNKSPISTLEIQPEFNDIKDSDFIEASKRSVFFEFTEKISELSENNPLVIFIDDVQWADKATLHLLNYMVLNLSDSPVLFICAYRSEALSRKHILKDIINRLNQYNNFEKMVLEPFDWNDTKKMVSSILNHNRLPSDFIDFIYNKTEGNPLFIKEFLELLIDEGKLPSQTSDYPVGKDQMETPQLIEDVLKRRINIHLTKKARNVASVCSVIGDEIPFNLLYKCLDMNEIKLLETIDELLNMEILYEKPEKDRYIFKHNLMSKVIYDEIPNIKKKKLHKIIAEKLNEINENNIEEYYSDIAFHFNEANENEKAVENFINAGEEASRVFAYEDAIDMYENALSLCNCDKEIDILERLAHVNKVIGNYNEAKRYFNTVKEKTNKNSLKLKSIFKLGEIYVNQGEYNKALKIAEEGLSFHDKDDKLFCKLLSIKGRVFSRKGNYNKAKKIYNKEKSIADNINDREELAQAFHHLGAVDINQGNIKRAEESLKKAVKIREELDDKIGLGESLNNLGIVYEKIGDYDKAMDYFKRTLTIEKEIGNKPNIMKTLNNMGIYSKIKGNIEKALEYYNESLEIAEKISDKPGMAKLNVNIGIIHGSTGDNKKALTHLNDALRIEKEIEDKPGMAGTLDNIGTIFQQKGKFKEALDYHKRSLEIGREIGDKNSIASSLFNIGSVFDKRKNYEKALDYYDKSLNLTEETENKRLKIFIYTGYVETYINLNKNKEAKEYAKKAYKLSEKIGLDSELASSKRYLGKVYLHTNSFDKAEDELKSAQELLEYSADKIEKYKIYYELGNLFRKQGELKKAKKHLEDSFKNFQEYDMNWWAEQCKISLNKIDN